MGAPYQPENWYQPDHYRVRRTGVIHQPHVSILTITEGRPEFYDWTLWQFFSQTYPNKQLVVVLPESEEKAFWKAVAVWKDHFTTSISVITNTCEAGLQVGPKRNLALQTAGCDLAHWMDDDDWHAPSLLERMVDVYVNGDPKLKCLMLTGDVPFVRLPDLKMRKVGPRFVWSCGLYDRQYVMQWPFQKTPSGRGSDTAWVATLRNRSKRNRKAISSVGWKKQFFAIAHGKNVSNPQSRRRFPDPALDESWFKDTDPEFVAETMRRVRELQKATQ
jgi:hypothetical protein